MERERRMWVLGPLGGILMVLALSDCHQRGPVTKGPLQPVWEVHTERVEARTIPSFRRIPKAVSGLLVLM